MSESNHLTEVYRNKRGAVYQDDERHHLIVEFCGTFTSLNIPCFVCLKNAVDRLDLDSMADDTGAGIEIITSCGCERCYIVDLASAYYFKDLLAGTKAMLELNSIIHERLVAVAAL